ncbi:hypothetical protein JYT14_00340 [Flavobacteriales bacterium AH-315-E23]|nr:hypothetical protein [Flavobacteriales bacterium AH-315-E23]
MKRSTKNRIKSVIRSIADPAAQNYLKLQQKFSYVPHKLSIYQNILKNASLDARIKVGPFGEQKSSRDHINLFLRHDIDTLKCIQNIDLLLDSNLDLNLPAGVYFRVDDDEYCLKDHRDVVNACREKGFETGLHTICYAHDDYLDQFKRETEKFADEAGFRPTTFTIHGMGEKRLSVRKNFIRHMIKRHSEFGYTFSDCHKSFRGYHHVIQDCHIDFTVNQRFIFDDFKDFPSFFRKGLNYLILTHPCYWEKD